MLKGKTGGTNEDMEPRGGRGRWCREDKGGGFGAGRQMGRSGPPWDRGEAGRPQSQAQQWSVMPQAEFKLSAENETGS